MNFKKLIFQGVGPQINFKNGSKIKFVHNKIKVFDYLNTMFDFTILFVALSAYEYEFYPTVKDDATGQILYIFLSIITVISFIVSFFQNSLLKEFDVLLNGTLSKDGGGVWSMIYKIGTNILFYIQLDNLDNNMHIYLIDDGLNYINQSALLIHPNIILYKKQCNIDYALDSFTAPTRYKRNINDFFLMFQFVVIYMKLMHTFFKHSYYFSDSAQRFASRINFQHSIVSAIKYYILYYKKLFMFFLIFNTIIFFGYLLKVMN